MPSHTLLERLLFPSVRLNARKLERRLSGKTVLITGASSGIGERLAYLLAGFDARLILTARRGDKLAAIKADIESRTGFRAAIDIFAADLRKPEQTDALLAYVSELPGGLDAVVSNAGHSIRRSVRESLDRYHDFTRTMAINYFAPVRLLLGVIPLLEKNGGHIANVSTVSALLLPVPNWAAYQASKSAFDVWLRSAAPELNALGVSVSSVYFPLVRTPMIAPTAAYKNAPAMSVEIAAKIVARTFYSRCRVYKPWWLAAGELASVLFRGVWERSAARKISRKERAR